MPWPWGASKEPITLPCLSKWIMEGGRTQQSATPISASSSMSVRSFGRSRTQTLSSLSTARPVTPPSFHLLGRGFGQSGSNLNFGAVGSVWAAKTAQKNTIARPVSLNFITLRFMVNKFAIPTHRLQLVRQRIRAKLNVLDVTELGFRELRHIRTVRRPDAAAFPSRPGIVDASIHSAREERHRIGQPEHGELFRLWIEHDQRISRRAGDDDRILPHAERIELIHPQEIWILGAARLASCACELRSG